MGHSRKRTLENGKVRYTAYYEDIKGRRRSAGTFPSKKAADKAWQDQEAELRRGIHRDPSHGRMTLEQYVREKWLPHHQMELTTRQKYVSSLDLHILPELGSMRMIDILPEHIRGWVTAMANKGASPWVIQHCKYSVLNAIFSTALNDEMIYIHPSRGVKIPSVPDTPRTIVTPEQFDALYLTIKDPDCRLLVETDIESGLRWGELTELRVKDLDVATRMLTVSRKVVELTTKTHPEGKRFLVTPYTKGKKSRRLKLSSEIVQKLKTHIQTHDLKPDDLLFQRRNQPPPRLRVVPIPEDLGRTEPNAKGHTYRHGTISAYNAAPCRCEHCRHAYALYRAKRRAAGKDEPRRPRVPDDDNHISRPWFHREIWKPAVKAAELGIKIRPHDLRHSHASWLLHGGADLEMVRERLGHASILTTQKYLHTLPEADDTAVDAFEKIRNRSQEKDTRQKGNAKREAEEAG
jgi:integrase